jgi:hypothetical protein
MVGGDLVDVGKEFLAGWTREWGQDVVDGCARNHQELVPPEWASIWSTPQLGSMIPEISSFRIFWL